MMHTHIIRIITIFIIWHNANIISGDGILCAARNGNLAKVTYLLQNNTSQYNLNNALHIAAYYEQPEIADILLAYGADPNTGSSIKNNSVTGTALHTAIYANALRTAHVILAHGINPNQHMAPIGGSTPLHLTASMDAVHLLIHHHAHTTQADDTIFEHDFIPAIHIQSPGKTPLERLFEKMCKSDYERHHTGTINMISVFLGYNAKITPLYQRIHAQAEDQRSIEIDRVLAGDVSHLNHITPLQALRICLGRKDNDNVKCLLKRFHIKQKACQTILSDCALFNNLSMLAVLASTYRISDKHIVNAFDRTAQLGSADDAGWIYVHRPQAIAQYHNTLSPPAQHAYSHVKQQKTLAEHRHMNHFTDCDIICNTSSNNDH